MPDVSARPDPEFAHADAANARYAAGKPTSPVAVKIDNTARLRLIVQTTLMQLPATQQIQKNSPPTEVKIRSSHFYNKAGGDVPR